MNRTNDWIDTLGKRAAGQAMTSAIDYLDANGLRSAVDVDALCAALKRIAPAAALEGMDEARRAGAAGLHGTWAEIAFKASMMAAGIKAAKEATAGLAVGK
jgi:hypothetical protein